MPRCCKFVSLTIFGFCILVNVQDTDNSAGVIE
jgi:hypothetical protein